MQTIGERLEDARKRKGVSIREAAEATKIRGDYLQKFEGNQFDFELAPIYKRGFLRSYANFLKIPADRILDDFESLHRPEPRQRQPSREIYGRMDVSISTEERPDHAAAAPAAPSAVETAARPGSQLRGPTSLPKGPPIDPALAFKGGIALAALLALIIIVWAVKSMVGGSSSSAAARMPPAAAAEPSITLIGLDSVHVVVTLQADGRVLSDSTLAPGQRLVVPRPGTVVIQADPPTNLRMEINGRQMQIPSGYDKVTLQSVR